MDLKYKKMDLRKHLVAFAKYEISIYGNVTANDKLKQIRIDAYLRTEVNKK